MTDSTTLIQNTHFNTNRRKEVFLEVLKKCDGVIGIASEQCKIERRSVYLWIEKDEEFAQKVKDIRNKHIDDAEKLVVQKSKTQLKPAFFILSHRHPEYIQKQQINLSTDIKQEDMD